MLKSTRRLIVLIAIFSFTVPLLLAADLTPAASLTSTPATKSKHHHIRPRTIVIPQDKDKTMTPHD